MQGNSRIVVSNQDSVHRRLTSLIERHRLSAYRRPASSIGAEVCQDVQSELVRTGRELILDFCCGVGESTQQLSLQYPHSFVVGLEKSELRSRAAVKLVAPLDEHSRVYRVNYVDFLQHAVRAGVRCSVQYWLYPNPWPKSEHLSRRWYAHPSFQWIVALGGVLEYRTNWEIGAQECATTFAYLGYPPSIQEELLIELEDTITPFERKFLLSGHRLWRVVVDLRNNENGDSASAVI
jgi:tRNA (guanine-N7-)-methyltransferase